MHICIIYQKTMKKLPLALAIAAITAGSAHADDIIYSTEDFEAGTPNYTFDGAGVETILQSGDPLANITTAMAFTGTDYYPRNASRMGVVANGAIPATNPESAPSGQHAFVSTAASRVMAFGDGDPLTNDMPLVSDGVQTLNISFSFLQSGNGFAAYGSAIVVYSASGIFDDSVQLKSFGIGEVGSAVVTPDFPAAAETWGSASFSFTADDVGGAFTDTAAIGFNKLAFGTNPTSPDSTTNHIFLLDDITITGIPAPAPAAPFAATITPAVDPATGYDIQWPSQTGATYTLFTNTDLDTPIDSWTLVEADLAASPPQNTYNVAADGVRRFYAVKEVTP